MNAISVIVVKAAFDLEAKVWFVDYSDIPGLNVEAESLESLQVKIPVALQDLLEDADGSAAPIDIPVEIIAHASARVRSPVAA